MGNTIVSGDISNEGTTRAIISVCLKDVVAPALRNMLKREIQKWYQILCQPPTKIDKQVYSRHETQLNHILNPSSVRLDYRNINYNEVRGSPRIYDYAVKDPLSLAKLFVSPMTMYWLSDFDQMDLLAVLSVICKAEPFIGAAVHARAVQSHVRYESLPSHFANWTETAFMAAFESMEMLLENVNLSAEEKHKCVTKLNHWKDLGLEILFRRSGGCNSEGVERPEAEAVQCHKDLGSGFKNEDSEKEAITPDTKSQLTFSKGMGSLVDSDVITKNDDTEGNNITDENAVSAMPVEDIRSSTSHEREGYGDVNPNDGYDQDLSGGFGERVKPAGVNYSQTGYDVGQSTSPPPAPWGNWGHGGGRGVRGISRGQYGAMKGTGQYDEGGNRGRGQFVVGNRGKGMSDRGRKESVGGNIGIRQFDGCSRGRGQVGGTRETGWVLEGSQGLGQDAARGRGQAGARGRGKDVSRGRGHGQVEGRGNGQTGNRGRRQDGTTSGRGLRVWMPGGGQQDGVRRRRPANRGRGRGDGGNSVPSGIKATKPLKNNNMDEVNGSTQSEPINRSDVNNSSTENIVQPTSRDASPARPSPTSFSDYLHLENSVETGDEMIFDEPDPFGCLVHVIVVTILCGLCLIMFYLKNGNP